MTIKVISAVLTSEHLTLMHLVNNTVKSVILHQSDIRVPSIIEKLQEHEENLAKTPCEISLEYGECQTVFEDFVKKFGEVEFIRILKGADAKASETKRHPIAIDVPNTCIVAIIGNLVISGVDNLSEQIQHQIEHDDPEPIVNFLKRVGNLQEYRNHSSDDLLKFIEKLDLPLTRDGCILAYKRLNKSDDLGNMVDVYTGNVPQSLGSIVTMHESLVDPDRNEQCSNGLHVARLDYLRSYSGNALCVVKVDPRNVIAVPSYDGSKMRVSTYEIIHVFDDDHANSIIKDNVAIRNEEDALLFTNLLEGNYQLPTSITTIGGHLGTNVKVQEISTNQKGERMIRPAKKVTAKAIKAAKPVTAKKIEESKFVKPSAVIKQTRKEQIHTLITKFYNRRSTKSMKKDIVAQIYKLKQEGKQSWATFGVSTKIVDDLAKYW